MTRVTGFLLQPAVWIGAAPEIRTLADVQGLRRTVLEDRLRCGLVVRVTLDGEFLFDFAGWPPGGDGDPQSVLRSRITVLNAFLAGLYTEHRRQQGRGPNLMLVESHELIIAKTLDAGLSVLGNDPVAHLLQVSDSSTYVPKRPPSDHRLWRSTIYAEAEVNAALQRLDALMSDVSRAEAADMLLRACVAHMSLAVHASLIQSWAIIERVLNLKWDAVRATLQLPLSSEPRLAHLDGRVRKGLDSNQPAIAHVIEALHCLGVVDRDLHAAIAAPRVARNKWMHELRPVSMEAAGRSLQAAEDVLREHFEVDLELVPQVMVVPAPT